MSLVDNRGCRINRLLDGEWAKIEFEARGAEIVYARQAEPEKGSGIEDSISGQ